MNNFDLWNWKMELWGAHHIIEINNNNIDIDYKFQITQEGIDFWKDLVYKEL